MNKDELKKNALASIRLGVEDFKKSKEEPSSGGDPERALSAVRNLFAGLLLLFKFKLASIAENSTVSDELVLMHREVLPRRGATGRIEWAPAVKAKSSINFHTLKTRMQALNISVDWNAVEALHETRNHLEHLHPTQSLGEVANFVANVFPVLQQFVVDEMVEVPAEMLGLSWATMLEHHDFFVTNRTSCLKKWELTDVPGGMQQWLEKCQCETCGSSLLEPLSDELLKGFTFAYDALKYSCLECGEVGDIIPLCIESMTQEQSAYSWFDGVDDPITECPSCGHNTYSSADRKCNWCGHHLKYEACSYCDEALGPDDQIHKGLCQDHANRLHKVIKE